VPVETTEVQSINEEAMLPSTATEEPTQVPVETTEVQSINEEAMLPSTATEEPTQVPVETTEVQSINEEAMLPSTATEEPIPTPVETTVNVQPVTEEVSTLGLPQEVSKSIETVMDFLTSKIADKVNIDINQQTSLDKASKIQNGFDAINEANEKIMSSSQNGGKNKKFRLTRKSRGK
jgi:hypothetical protein